MSWKFLQVSELFLDFLSVPEFFCQVLWKFLQVSELFLDFLSVPDFFKCLVLWKFLQVSELFLDFLSKCQFFSKCRILLIFLQVPVFFKFWDQNGVAKVPRRLVSGMSSCLDRH